MKKEELFSLQDEDLDEEENAEDAELMEDDYSDYDDFDEANSDELDYDE